MIKEPIACSINNTPMPARCAKHRVSLRRKWVGGKPTLVCRYSHKRVNRDRAFPKMCRKCRREPAGEEGLCYPCRYYRSP